MNQSHASPTPEYSIYSFIADIASIFKRIKELEAPKKKIPSFMRKSISELQNVHKHLHSPLFQLKINNGMKNITITFHFHCLFFIDL